MTGGGAEAGSPTEPADAGPPTESADAGSPTEATETGPSTEPGEAATGGLRERVPEVKVFATPRDRRRFLLHALVAVGVVAAAGWLAGPYLAVLTDAAELRRIVGGFGVLAPLALVVLQAAQVVLAPVPGQVLAVVAGYLFGAWWGTLYNLLGVVLGSTVAFWLSRRFGRQYVESIVHPDLLARFDAIDDGHARLALFLVFLVPGLPDDVVCFAGGLTRIPLWQLVVIAAVGRAPGFFLVNVVGDLLGTGRYAEGLVLAAAVVGLTALAYQHRDRLLGYLLGEE